MISVAHMHYYMELCVEQGIRRTTLPQRQCKNKERSNEQNTPLKRQQRTGRAPPRPSPPAPRS